MKGLFKLLLFLVIVVGGGGWLYGRSLPRVHVTTSTITLVAPVDTVWKVIRDIGRTPEWWSDMKSVQRIPGRSRESYEQNMGLAGIMRVEVTRSVPGRSMLITILDGEEQGWGGTWTYEIGATGSGTEVMLIEEGFVDSPYFRVFAKMMGHRRTMESYLRSLGAHFGEVVNPRRG